MICEGAYICPRCGGPLKYYDKVFRTITTEGRVSNRIKIRRFKCHVCGSIHRALPEHILPYKHYETRIIMAVIYGYVSSDTLGFEDYPCEMTMIRWLSRKKQILLWNTK